MPRRKKPYFLKTLFGGFATSLIWVGVVLIPAGIQVYQFFGGTVAMFEKLPAWAYFVPLVVYVIVVTGRAIDQNRKELNEYNLSRKKPARIRPKVNKADNDSIAMQDVRNSPVIKDSKFFQGGTHFHGTDRGSEKEKSAIDEKSEIYQNYQVRKNDTWESIADREYGDRKSARRLKEANPSVISLSTGQYIYVPIIRISSFSRENGQYVSIKVVNGNKDKPVLCKAVIRKMDVYNGSDWIPVDVEDDGPLSWHLGGSDNNGFKEVFLSAEFINIAKKHSLSMSDKIVFTHIVEKYRKSGRYRMFIEVIYKFSDKPRTETWYGYIDKVEAKLEIMEMEDVSEWK